MTAKPLPFLFYSCLVSAMASDSSRERVTGGSDGGMWFLPLAFAREAIIVQRQDSDSQILEMGY